MKKNEIINSEDKLSLYLKSKIKWDWVSFICFLLIVAATIIVVFYLFEAKVNSCTSDPLKYSIEKIKILTDSEEVYGIIYLLKNGKVLHTQYFGDGSEEMNKALNYEKMNLSLE